MTEHKFTVDQCCCGCTLRTGSMIIAILYLISDILILAEAAYAATSGHQSSSWMGVIVSILLVLGIRQEKRNFIMVWVWVTIVYCVLIAILAIFSFIALAWGAAVYLTVQFLISGYFCVVVRSYAISIGGGVGSPA